MKPEVKIGSRLIGPSHPVFIAAEIGINHNGDIEIARRLIEVAATAGCDAVKFQKRTPEFCVPMHQRAKMRSTPWGYINYMEYRRRMELERPDFRGLDQYCRERGLIWFTSCWDPLSVDFMESFDPPCYKVPSAAVTDRELLEKIRSTGRPVILSTGMSTLEQIYRAVEVLGEEDLIILHCNATYPCPPEQLNLKTIQTLAREFSGCPVGYSGHEVGIPTTVAAVALGACFVERHITLDRSLWGSDQAASLEPQGLERLVKYIRVVEEAAGDGKKRIYPSEFEALKRLRRSSELVADAAAS